MSKVNQEAILAASDQQLNEWAAEKVMGWTLYYEQMDFEPVTDLLQAIALLDHLEKQGFYNSIHSNVGQPHRVHVGKRYEGGYVNGSCESKSRSRAIVVACLLAVVDGGE